MTIHELFHMWLEGLPYALPFLILIVGAMAMEYEMRKHK